jgi:hypothetical protein
LAGSEEVHKTADLVVVLAESTNNNGRDPAQVFSSFSLELSPEGRGRQRREQGMAIFIYVLRVLRR